MMTHNENTLNDLSQKTDKFREVGIRNRIKYNKF